MSTLFPEVDDTESADAWLAKPEHSPAPSELPTQPVRADDIVDASDESLEVLERILGLLPRTQPYENVRAVAATAYPDGLIEVQLIGDPLHALAIWMCEEDRSPRFARTDALTLWYSAPEARESHAPFMKRIARRLERVPAAAIARGLRADPNAAVRVKPGSLEAIEMPGSISHTYDHALTWRNFVEGHDFFRGMCQGGFRGRVVTVHHADVECAHNQPPPDGDPLRFYNHLQRELPRDATNNAFARDESALITTDMNDVEVIKGADGKLDALLDQVARWEKPPEMVVIVSTCISKVTGDDTGAAAEKFKKKVRVPVLDLGNPMSPTQAAIEGAIAQHKGARVPRNPGSVNLVGLPHVAGHAVLLGMLERVGVNVNMLLLPDVDLPRLAMYAAADAQVFYPWSWNEPIYALLEANMPMKTVRTGSPFGWAASRAWLECVADAVGAGDAMRALIATELETWAPRWERWRDRARGCALGLVGDDASLARMAKGEELLGISLIDSLLEMGFRLEVIRYRAPRAKSTPCPVQGPHVVERAFTTPDELEHALRTSPAGAFYSEYFFDRRLTRTGHAVFSLSQFEMGIAGTVRAIERLVRRCEMSFYRSHAGRLGRAFFARERSETDAEARA